jgi:hypothetical protein
LSDFKIQAIVAHRFFEEKFGDGFESGVLFFFGQLLVFKQLQKFYVCFSIVFSRRFMIALLVEASELCNPRGCGYFYHYNF